MEFAHEGIMKEMAMGCCGQRREMLRASHRPVTHPAVLHNRVTLVYVGDTAITVRGMRTGLTYRVARRQAVAVDARDAPALLSSRRFVRT